MISRSFLCSNTLKYQRDLKCTTSRIWLLQSLQNVFLQLFFTRKRSSKKNWKIQSSFLTHIAPTQITAKQPVLYIKIHFSSLCAIIDIIFYANDVLYVLRILDTALLINNPDRSLNNYHISEGYKNSTTYLKNE